MLGGQLIDLKTNLYTLLALLRRASANGFLKSSRHRRLLFKIACRGFSAIERPYANAGKILKAGIDIDRINFDRLPV